VNSSGLQANDTSYGPSISEDGRYVAFWSNASNLVGGDVNHVRDIFVRDTVANTTTLISIASDGTQGNMDSESPSISADGRYVAFKSWATNLAGGDTNGREDVFVRDTVLNTTTRVSIAANGTQGNSDSNSPSISADGRFVAFQSSADNLVSGDTNQVSDIFLRDTVMNITTRVSVTTGGAQGGQFEGSISPSISADGRFVAFESTAELVSGETMLGSDIFVRDTVLNTTNLISIASNGLQSNMDSYDPSISSDGRYVAFESWATNLVSGDTNSLRDIFVRDTQAGTTIRISVATSGAQTTSWSSYDPSISADGRYVVFITIANNLVSGDTNNMDDVFLRDTLMGITTRVSIDTNGIQASSPSEAPSISADGSFVAFSSLANNLVIGDTSGGSDVFVHETGNTPPKVASIINADANPATAASVHFTVTFSKSVSGVDVADFALIKTGDITGESITTVSGSDAAYTVTINTGTGSGTLRLDVPDTASIQDLVGNTLTELPYTDGESYSMRIQTFADVPTSYWAWNFIERLYSVSITGGCGSNPLSYCPEKQVTRAQMAVFLLKGMYGAAYTPPNATGIVFNDIPADHMFAKWIEQLAAEGITGGCGNGNYCPDAPVTREQLAVFLLRAEHGNTYNPPAATGVFNDVPAGYWAAPWIEQLATEGITGGCGGGKFCPKTIVNRAQMAVFLVGTFNLP
jgi:hypothetical protein